MTVTIGQTHFDFFTSTQSSWQAMLNDCKKAERSIYYEQYILDNDECGLQFLNLFADKARQGVNVHIRLDFIGSRKTRHTQSIKNLREAGATVEYYRPLKIIDIVRVHRWFPRTHLKCMVVDGKVGYFGSACVAKKMADWRDTYIRMTGDTVAAMTRAFSLPQNFIIEPMQGENPSGDFDFQINDPERRYNPVYDDLVDAIDHAKNSIQIATPYFVPPKLLARSLFRAKERGVNITIMVSQESDMHVADWAARIEFERFLKRDIQIYLYTRSVLHAKYVIVDGRWATVGSTNIDYLSLYKNREANMAFVSPQLVQILDDHYNDDMLYCMKVDLKYCRNMSWPKRMLCAFIRQYRKFL